MAYLVYWYGSKERKDCYSFVPQPKFIAHDDTKSLKKLKITTTMPPKVRKKLDAGTELILAEEEVVRTFREYEEDLQKEPEDRKRGDVVFPEEWELLTLDDVRNVENGLDSEDSDVESKEVKVNLTSKKKKSKMVADDSDDHDDGSDDGAQQSNVARNRKQDNLGAVDDEQKLTTKKRGLESAGNLKANLEDSSEASDAEVLPKKKRKLNATKVNKLKNEEASGSPQTTQEEKTFKL
jgi:hypothetical protein